MKKCPYCRKANPDEGKICWYCKAEIPEEKPVKTSDKKTDNKGAKE